MKQLDRSLSVAVIYNMVDDPSRVDICSVVGSVTELQQTLMALGHRVQLLRVDKGVGRFVDALESLQRDVVFNLCDGYREWSAGEPRIAGLLELLGIPYTISIRDYGRVDFRMNAQGRVYVLEVNPNPDVSTGSGYRRSLEAADISYSDFVAVLLHNALQRGPEFHG